MADIIQSQANLCYSTPQTEAISRGAILNAGLDINLFRNPLYQQAASEVKTLIRTFALDSAKRAAYLGIVRGLEGHYLVNLSILTTVKNETELTNHPLYQSASCEIKELIHTYANEAIVYAACNGVESGYKSYKSKLAISPS